LRLPAKFVFITAAVIFVSGCGHAPSPWRAAFEETLTRELAAFPPERPLTVATNLYVDYGEAVRFRPNLTLVNIGDESLIPFYRIDAYLAVNVPDADNPAPPPLPKENPGTMLLAYGSSPLRADEKTRWVDLAQRNEMSTYQAALATVPRSVAIDRTKGLELAVRPWVSLSETTFDIAGRTYRGHELIRAAWSGLDVIMYKDTISLRFTRPPPLFQAGWTVVRAYPWMLGSRRNEPIRGHLVFMDRRQGDFSCPFPEARVTDCDYRESDAH